MGLAGTGIPLAAICCDKTNTDASAKCFTTTNLLEPQIDVYKRQYPEYAAFRVTGPAGVPVPYHIQIDGIIGGGLPYGKGIVIERGRSFLLKFVAIHTLQTNVTIGEEVSNIVLDGGGYEHCWSYKINPKSRHAIRVPVLRDLDSGSVSPSEGEHC